MGYAAAATVADEGHADDEPKETHVPPTVEQVAGRTVRRSAGATLG